MWPIKYTIKCLILFYFISFAEETKQTKKTNNVIKLKKGQGHRNSWGQLQRARLRIMLGLHNPETCIFNRFRTKSSSANNINGENMNPSLLVNSSTCDGGWCCFWFQETGLVKANNCTVRKFYICESGEKLKIIITKLLLLLLSLLLLLLLLLQVIPV